MTLIRIYGLIVVLGRIQYFLTSVAYIIQTCKLPEEFDKLHWYLQPFHSEYFNGCIFKMYLGVSPGRMKQNFTYFICLNRHPATFPMSNCLYLTSKVNRKKIDLFPLCTSYPLKNGIFSKMEGVLSRGVETTLLIKMLQKKGANGCLILEMLRDDDLGG